MQCMLEVALCDASRSDLRVQYTKESLAWQTKPTQPTPAPQVHTYYYTSTTIQHLITLMHSEIQSRNWAKVVSLTQILQTPNFKTFFQKECSSHPLHVICVHVRTSQKHQCTTGMTKKPSPLPPLFWSWAKMSTCFLVFSHAVLPRAHCMSRQDVA